MINYKKYFKYKNKYLQLKINSNDCDFPIQIINYISKDILNKLLDENNKNIHSSGKNNIRLIHNNRHYIIDNILSIIDTKIINKEFYIIRNYNNIIYSLEKDGLFLNQLPEIYKNLIKFILIAVKQNSKSIHYVEKYLLMKIINNLESTEENKELILSGIKENILIYNFINNELKNNIEFAKKALKINIDIYLYISNNIKNNKNLIYSLLDNDISYYKNLSKKLQNNKEIISYIIKYNNPNNMLYILHIGFIKLDEKHSETYINYTFINIFTNTINYIIDKLFIFIQQANINSCIFISLDILSYLQYFKSTENLSEIFFPILQDLSDTNKFISIDCNEQLKILEYNNTNKFLQYFIEQLYIQLNLLITQTIINCKNIKIINIADNNVLNNSNKFCKIVNIHINKFMVKHNKDYYINNIYTFKDCIYSSIKLSRSQINNTKLITHWLYNLINVSKLLEEKPIRKCGTCAMDSIFNSVYLIEDIKNLMILRPEDYKQNKFYINNIFPPKYEKLCIINIMENKC